MTYYRVPIINDDRKQVIHGTILGGSSLLKSKNGRNYYLSMRGKNGKWLQCKAQEIGFMPPNPYLMDGEYFRWHSQCSPLFNEFYDIYYKDGKKSINMQVLDGLRAIALTVWFLDAGRMKNGKLKLSVRSFVDGSTSLVKEYLSNLDIHSKIIGKAVQMDKLSTKKFINIVINYIPQFILFGN